MENELIFSVLGMIKAYPMRNDKNEMNIYIIDFSGEQAFAGS